ncbi:biosynthetic-type acetolactate synthase large subunit [Aureispira anguillae]|uniref:Acetolactate synthase n=1 Tax=Aureispira anguillae TaxID=2864201 RepID=A0A916DTN3_9BACT|nr:biosynthetic-type acetolactate synthase large subunit [Aureispira anguillae]BDS11937.1 biosynthetic-type acetolactate synthase large subunit [Aureispira anguillae]
MEKAILLERKAKKNSAPKTSIKGAEAILKILLKENVDTLFGYPGGAIMPVYDALHEYKEELRHILTRHEQGAIHAAQGYARVTGKVGVCLATSGPGATNLITGLADAFIDSTPLVCITGQVHSSLLGTDAFQETDVINLSMPVTKWNCQITTAADIPQVLAKAFYLARSGRPGPVLIDITKDAQFDHLQMDYQSCTTVKTYQPKPQLDARQVELAAKLINKAKKPLVLVGQGVILANAEEELKQFIEKIDAPTAWTMLGLSALPSDHRLNVGMLGMHGNYAANIKTNECDVLIAVGMRFDDRVTGDLNRYAKQAKVIHLEIDAAEINKNVYAHLPVLGDAKESLSALTALVAVNLHAEWLESFAVLEQVEYEKVIQDQLYPTKAKMTMAEVVHLVSECSKQDAILVTDVGQHQMVAARYFKFKQSKSNITSGGLGTMGFALPAALGAKLGNPNRTVIAFIGDGGFQMTLQELATIQQEQLEVKIIILNNSYLGMVRQWQEMFFEKRYSETSISSPDFIQLAGAYGIAGKRITERESLPKAVEEMLQHDGAYLLEVVVGQEDNVFPMIPTGYAVSEILLEPNS